MLKLRKNNQKIEAVRFGGIDTNLRLSGETDALKNQGEETVGKTESEIRRALTGGGLTYKYALGVLVHLSDQKDSLYKGVPIGENPVTASIKFQKRKRRML